MIGRNRSIRESYVHGPRFACRPWRPSRRRLGLPGCAGVPARTFARGAALAGRRVAAYLSWRPSVRRRPSILPPRRPGLPYIRFANRAFANRAVRNTPDASGRLSASPANAAKPNANTSRRTTATTPNAPPESAAALRPTGARARPRAPQIPAMPRNGAPEQSNANPGPSAPRRLLPATAPREAAARMERGYRRVRGAPNWFR